ncbi:YciI family protein [Streptomyces tanashiensis]
MVIDLLDSYERAVELAGNSRPPPGPARKPIHEWLELRPFLAEPPTITE